MKIAERVVMIVLLLVFIAGGLFIYISVQAERQSVRDAVARGEFEKPVEEDNKYVKPEDWKLVYPSTAPLSIGSTSVQASVADTLAERIKGLSNTPFLPPNVVKLFAFGTAGSHSIWMKDMNYPIDIMWVAEKGEIVHIEENVSPETYPEAFSSPVPAWYVIEANAGFVASNTILVGDDVVIFD